MLEIEKIVNDYGDVFVKVYLNNKCILMTLWTGETDDELTDMALDFQAKKAV